jgi:YD repeat-containing protein
MPDQNFYSVNSYETRSEFNYLSSKKIFEYDTNGLNPIKTELQYFYNNPLHFGITKEKNIQPDAVVNETSYSYAHEKGNQLMIDRNMVGIPLETTETQAIGSVTKTIDKTEIIYPALLPSTQAGNLVLPLSVKSYDALNNISFTDVTFDKYDDKGNIVQYTTKSGIPVTIIWGYNKTQPIAKVEGMTYDQLTALSTTSSIILASNEDASDSTKEGLLLTALNNFRKESALAGKKITTYTYDPLIGVTSITSPLGIREIFVYDSFGRLKEGNIRLQNTSGTYIQQTAKKINYKYKQ